MAASISATLIPCLKSFNQIHELVSRPDYDYEDDVPSVAWSDELGRLRVWAANIGAHQTGQSSLEFRLRDASHISHQITKLLKDLDGTLNSLKDEVSDDYVEASEVITLADDEDAWPEDEDSTSELQQLYEEVVNIVDCLYKMSMLIRRPAQHDVLLGSHKSDAAAFEPFDREHVRNKYSDADDVTIHRLGRAITQRRKYLKYRDRHHAKLGKGIEEVQGIQGIHGTATQSALSETVATDFKNQNIDFEETPSNSGVSQTSYAPSLMGGGSITIPPPPKNSAAGKPFECPYCFFLIDIRGKRSWARHIFKDIKPYVCTFSDCSTPDRLFESRREWFFHMTTKHRVEDLTCPLCKDILTSTKQFERHVARHLEELALFALPRNEIDDDSDEDELDARASTNGYLLGPRSVDSESSGEDDQTDDFVAEQASYSRERPSRRETQRSIIHDDEASELNHDEPRSVTFAVEMQDDHDREQISPGPDNVSTARAPEQASLQKQDDGSRSRSDGNRRYQETERLTPVKLGSSEGVTPSRTGSFRGVDGWWTCHRCDHLNTLQESCIICAHKKCTSCHGHRLEPKDQAKTKEGGGNDPKAAVLVKHFEQLSQQFERERIRERRTHVERMERLDGKRGRGIVNQSEIASARVAREADEHEREAQQKALELI